MVIWDLLGRIIEALIIAQGLSLIGTNISYGIRKGLEDVANAIKNTEKNK